MQLLQPLQSEVFFYIVSHSGRLPQLWSEFEHLLDKYVLDVHSEEHAFSQVHCLHPSLLQVLLDLNVDELDAETVEIVTLPVHLHDEHLLVLVIVQHFANALHSLLRFSVLHQDDTAQRFGICQAATHDGLLEDSALCHEIII